MTNEARMSKGRSKPKGLPSFGLAYSFVIRRSTFCDCAISLSFPQNGVITNPGDAGMLVPDIVAAGGLLFAFDHATIAGKIVLTLLAVASIFSWSIMITKLRVIRFARKQNARFLAAFHKDRQPLRLFEKNARFPGAPVFNVYRAGCEDISSARLSRSG